MNKKSILILFAFFAFVFISCKKQAELPENFVFGTLENSSWAGTLEVKTSKGISRYDVKISFGPSEMGFYTYRDIEVKQIESGGFEYLLKGKLLHFDYGYNNILAGDWLIESAEKDSFQIVRNIENPDNIGRLKLNKIL